MRSVSKYDALSVVIPTHKQTYLRDCLLAFQEQSVEQFEIIVVENGSFDAEFQAWLAKQSFNTPIKLVRTERAGLNRARNIGCAAASFSLIALIDDDCIPHKKWAANITAAHNRQPQAGTIGGPVNLRFLDAVPEWVIAPFRAYLSEVNFGSSFRVLGEQEDLVGANLSFSRTVMERVGGFDEGVGMSGRVEPQLSNDETKFCHSISNELLLNNYYCPNCAVDHLIPASRTTPDYFEQRMYGQGRSDILSYLLEMANTVNAPEFPDRFVGDGVGLHGLIMNGQQQIQSRNQAEQYALCVLRSILANLSGQCGEFIHQAVPHVATSIDGTVEYQTGSKQFSTFVYQKKTKGWLFEHLVNRLALTMAMPAQYSGQHSRYLEQMVARVARLNGFLDGYLERNQPDYRRYGWL